MLGPKAEAEGNYVFCVRTVDVMVTLGTNSGWNLRAPGPRSRDLCGLSGSFFSFFDTRVDRLAAGDSRLSLEERYGDHEGFVDAGRQAVRELTADRFLLTEDAETIIRLAKDSDILH